MIEPSSARGGEGDSRHRTVWWRFKRNVRSRLIAGLLIGLPILITFLLLRFLFRLADGILSPLMDRIVRGVVYLWTEEHRPDLHVPGVGLIGILAFFYGVGVLAANLIGRRIIHYGERLLTRMPFVRGIYTSSRELIHFVASPDKAGFKRVVLVDYPRPGLKAVGFVAREIQDSRTEERLLNIFVPTTPNPTTGMMVIAPEGEVVETSLSVEDGMKLVISGGILSPGAITLSGPGLPYGLPNGATTHHGDTETRRI